MNVVVNLEMPSKRSVTPFAPVVSGNQGDVSVQHSFRGTLEALKGDANPQLTNNTVEKIVSNIVDDKTHEDSSIESLENLLVEIESFVKEEFDLLTFGDVFNILPSDSVIQIETFITAIQNGEHSFNFDQITEVEDLIGILLAMQSYTQNYSLSDRDGLLNLLKQLKTSAQEMMLQTQQIHKEVTDLRSNKLVHELLQSIENQLTKTEKPLTESQSRFQYLQTVHARFFSTPKGIDSTVDKQFRNGSNIMQESIVPNRLPVEAGTIGLQKNRTVPEMLIQKASTISQVAGATSDMVPMGDVSQSQLSKVQQFSLFIEQNGKQLPNQQQFIKQFQSILARSGFLNMGGQQRLFINLYPEHLGALRIELLQSEAGMIARIMASTSQAKELVESQLTNLKQTFLSQNISVEKIEVTTQHQFQTERNIQRDSEQQQGRQSGQQQEEQNKQEPNEEQSFSAALLDELVNFKV